MLADPAVSIIPAVSDAPTCEVCYFVTVLLNADCFFLLWTYLSLIFKGT